MLSLQGRARCELALDDASGRAAFGCNRLRWDGAAPQAARLELDEPVLRLYSGDFLQTRPNPMVDMMIRSQALRLMQDNPMALYGARSPSAETVVGLSRTVLAIESACESAAGAAISACDELKKAFVDSILLARETPESWLELFRLAEAGAFKAKGRGDDGVMMSRDVRRMRDQARSSMRPTVEVALDRASRTMMASQQGGFVLRVLPGPHAALPALNGRYSEDLLAVWDEQIRMMSPDGALPFKVSGMVVGTGVDASGSPEITVDAARTADDPWPAVARMAWMLLAGLLVLAHAPLAVIRMRAASARERALQEYARQRSAAKPAFF